MGYEDRAEFKSLLGKTLVEISGLEKGSDQVRFVCSDGIQFVMLHNQDCCEGVSIDDVIGDATDLIGLPILLAEESITMTDTQLLIDCRAIVHRYLTQTPLGNQPHMISREAEDVIARLTAVIAQYAHPPQQQARVTVTTK